MSNLTTLVDDALHYRNVGGHGCFKHSQDAVDLLKHGEAALNEIERATISDVATRSNPDELRGFHSVMVTYNKLIDENQLYGRAVDFAKMLPPDCLVFLLSGMYIVFGCGKPTRKLPTTYCDYLIELAADPKNNAVTGIKSSIDQIFANTNN